jgi:Mn2+/Fe2+ NRAMP family transporter
VVAVPLMAVIIVLATKKSVMGKFTARKPIVVLAWLTTGLMGAASVRMFLPD